jgi:hypothetical protein
VKTVLALLPLTLAACTTTDFMRDARPTPPPGPDEAKVVVYRTSQFGGADNFSVVDGDGTLLGFTETDCYFEIRRPPGRHLFAARGEGDAFVEADLAGGKTYYIRAYSKFGVWSSRPGFAPVGRGSEHSGEIDRVLPTLRCRELDPAKSRDYRVRPLAEIEDLRALRPEDGRDEPAALPAK